MSCRPATTLQTRPASMRGGLRRPRPLFADWERVARAVTESPRLLLFLDFDGTLVNIAPRPDLVVVSMATRRILARLAAHPRTEVHVVSARRRWEIRTLLGVPGLHYCGLYGWEREVRIALPPATRRALRRALALLTRQLQHIPGLWIEDKQSSLSIHWKDAGAVSRRRALQDACCILRQSHGQLRVIENLRDAEVLPCAIPDKGSFVREILRTGSAARSLPFYFGDDLSDEPAFAAAARGITIRVGHPRPTCAQYWLRTPAHVARALKQLEALLP